MKKKSIFWGIALICAAILIIVDAVGTGVGFLDSIPVVKIILGVLCVCWIGNELYKRQLPHIFFPLAFIFMLFEKEIAGLFQIESGEIISNWLLLLCALLLTIGTSIICSQSSRTGYGSKGHKIMGKSTQYIDCSDFTRQNVENNMGATDVYFENTDNYQGGGTLNLENNMGSVLIHIPSGWRVIASIENNMGSIKMPSTGNPAGKVINLVGENNMGSITVEFV